MLKAKMSIMSFLFGGVIYSLCEILFRGYTHWSMTITGGLCFLIMYWHFTYNPNESITRKCFFGMVVITTLEFTAGCIVNLWLCLNVWDYSSHYLNFLGQICLLFSIMWYFISYFAVLLCNFLNKQMNVFIPDKEPYPQIQTAPASI